MIGMLLATSSIIGFDNVSYDVYTFNPAHYIYETPVSGVHYIKPNSEAIFYPINGWEIHDPGIGWFSGSYESWNALPPDNARRSIPDNYTWNPSGNQGYKTKAEYAVLQADVTAGAKRNLIGTPVYG